MAEAKMRFVLLFTVYLLVRNIFKMLLNLPMSTLVVNPCYYRVLMPTWEERLSGQIDPQIAEEIDVFETQIKLRKQGKLDEKVFAETRLRRGAYGQRYDNGHRNDGFRTQTLSFPSGDLTKGPETMIALSTSGCSMKFGVMLKLLTSAKNRDTKIFSRNVSSGS